MNNVRAVESLTEQELQAGIFGGLSKGSWHEKYENSAWVFLGGFPYELSEGDIICVMSQWGEIEDINLARDKTTNKSKGFAFIKYEDTRSTILAVDNFNGMKLLGRTLRCDHVDQYKLPKDVREKELERMKDDPTSVAEVGPGHAYKNQALATDHSISQGVDLWNQSSTTNTSTNTIGNANPRLSEADLHNDEHDIMEKSGKRKKKKEKEKKEKKDKKQKKRGLPQEPQREKDEEDVVTKTDRGSSKRHNKDDGSSSSSSHRHKHHRQSQQQQEARATSSSSNSSIELDRRSGAPRHSSSDIPSRALSSTSSSSSSSSSSALVHATEVAEVASWRGSRDPHRSIPALTTTTAGAAGGGGGVSSSGGAPAATVSGIGGFARVR